MGGLGIRVTPKTSSKISDRIELGPQATQLAQNAKTKRLRLKPRRNLVIKIGLSITQRLRKIHVGIISLSIFLNKALFVFLLNHKLKSYVYVSRASTKSIPPHQEVVFGAL